MTLSKGDKSVNILMDFYVDINRRKKVMKARV